MYGDAAATVAGVASKVPVFGALSPDAAEARSCVNSLTGADQADPNAQGNIGNKIGTVAGAVIGGIGGPGGAATGAMLGSTAGGWIGKALGANQDDDTGPITVPVSNNPYDYPTKQMEPEPD
ncbi:MAG TPA: hypothetical protein VKE22_12040 [Haliangiales bacterium]|nr:hypothetical protein [Haliangiales bacterium]